MASKVGELRHAEFLELTSIAAHQQFDQKPGQALAGLEMREGEGTQRRIDEAVHACAAVGDGAEIDANTTAAG